MKTLTLDHLDLSNNPNTYLNSDYSSGTTITVANSSGFSVNDYLVFEKIGNTEIAEMGQIQSITNNTTIVLKQALSFSHVSGASVVQIPYNQFKVYRSATGVGGAYTQVSGSPFNIQVDKETNTYQDATAVSPYSYKMSWFNSQTSVESAFTDEIPYAGFPAWSVRGIQDSVMYLFKGDTREVFLTRDLILTWINEAVSKLQFLITNGESPYFINSVNKNSNAFTNREDTYDLSAQSPLGIFLVEYSTDGGLTFPVSNRITPKDFRNKDYAGNVDYYDWRLEGSTLRINPALPTGYIMRVWYSTNPTQLSNQSDVLPDPFKPHSDIIINYCLMRAHEKDRKFSEIATYYRSEWRDATQSPMSIIHKIKSRIFQANKAISTTYGDDYDTGFGMF